ASTGATSKVFAANRQRIVFQASGEPSNRPSGEIVNHSVPLLKLNRVQSGCESSTDQILALASSLPEKINRPFGLNVSVTTGLVWPSRMRICLPVRASQSRIVLS